MDRQINKFVYKKVIMDGENYMNKKIIQIMLAILLAFALSGCGKGKVQKMISILNWKRINRAAMI